MISQTHTTTRGGGDGGASNRLTTMADTSADLGIYFPTGAVTIITTRPTQGNFIVG